jgi:hypothetical protein
VIPGESGWPLGALIAAPKGAAEWTAAEGGFLVVCNFDTREMQRIELDLAHELGATGRFVGEELLTGSGARYEKEHFTLTLPRCGAMVIRFSRR